MFAFFSCSITMRDSTESSIQRRVMTPFIRISTFPEYPGLVAKDPNVNELTARNSARSSERTYKDASGRYGDNDQRTATLLQGSTN